MSETGTPDYDPNTTRLAEAPPQPIPPAVQAALDAAIARIEALEKFLIVSVGTQPSPGPFTNTPATAAASEAVATDPLAEPAKPAIIPEPTPGAATGEPLPPSPS